MLPAWTRPPPSLLLVSAAGGQSPGNNENGEQRCFPDVGVPEASGCEPVLRVPRRPRAELTAGPPVPKQTPAVGLPAIHASVCKALSSGPWSLPSPYPDPVSLETKFLLWSRCRRDPGGGAAGRCFSEPQFPHLCNGAICSCAPPRVDVGLAGREDLENARRGPVLPTLWGQVCAGEVQLSCTD